MQATLPRARNNMISGITAATAVALGLVAVSFTSSRAQEPPHPILVEPLTPRSVFTDNTRGQFTSTLDGEVVCPPGLPPGPRPADFFVPTQDCTGWVPNDHPLAGGTGTDVLDLRDLSRTVSPGSPSSPGRSSRGTRTLAQSSSTSPRVSCVCRSERLHRAAVPGGHGVPGPRPRPRPHRFQPHRRCDGGLRDLLRSPAEGPLTITAGIEAPADCQVGS